MKITSHFGKQKLWNIFKQNLLTIATFAGVVLGILIGVAIKESEDPDDQWTSRQVMYLKFIGALFLNMLKSVIIPLIIPSLIASIGSLDLSLSGRIGLRAIVYYLSTTVFAVILGIILVVSIRPGVTSNSGNSTDPIDMSKQRNVTTADTLMDLVRNCFPPNIVQALLHQYQTKIMYPDKEPMKLGDPDPADKNTWMVKGNWTNSTNILGLVVFSIATGIAIALSGEEGKPLLRFFQSVSVVMMKVTTWIIHLAPVGVLFLIAGQLAEMDNIGEEFGKLGWYFGTVILGLVIHGLMVLPLLFTLITRTLPFRFLGNMSGAYMTAFGTASSSATLPVTIASLEEKNGVDPRIARFVLPIGATINMDGTALYEAVAAIFIAQMNGMTLSIGQIIAISITATAASIGAAGIPQAGLVTMVMVLDTVGLPSESISIILSLDWLLDRFRTAINVLGDSIGAGIVNHLSSKELEAMNSSQGSDPESIQMTGQKS